MNEFSNETGAYARAGIRHGRRLRHLHRLHRLSDGLFDGQDLRCGERGGRPFGHHRAPESTGRPGGFPRRGRTDRPGRGGNRRAVYELHKALADVARTGDEQLRSEAAQIVAEASARLSRLLTADR